MSSPGERRGCRAALWALWPPCPCRFVPVATGTLLPIVSKEQGQRDGAGDTPGRYRRPAQLGCGMWQLLGEPGCARPRVPAELLSGSAMCSSFPHLLPHQHLASPKASQRHGTAQSCSSAPGRCPRTALGSREP